MRSNTNRSIAAAAALFLAATVSSSLAHAYCRTATQGLEPAAKNCSISGNQCCTVGKPLWWRSSCIGFSMQEDASKYIDIGTARTVMQAAFNKWHNATCAGGQPTSIDFRELADVTCDQVQYNKNPNQGNANIIVFRDTVWAHSDASNTLGLTTVTFDPDSGELYDADMELNTATQKLTVSPPASLGSNDYDFDSIVTHEAGHFLGLAHSGDTSATMYYRYNPGSTNMRSLTPDDVAGVCSIYVPAAVKGQTGTRNTADGGVEQASSCDPTPRHGFAKVCGDGSNYDGSSATGCAVTPDQSAATSKAGLFAAIGLVLGFGVRRAKRRNSRGK